MPGDKTVQMIVESGPSPRRLFLAFLRTGLTAFGGPAMIAYIRKMAVGRKKWLDDECFGEGVALCQAVPGATAMQMAAYVGLRVGGLRGALACYVGFGLPAFLLMLALSIAYSSTHALPLAVSIFGGLRAVIVAIVANAALTFGRASVKSWRNAVIAALASGLFLIMANPVLIVLLAAGLGVLSGAQKPSRATPPKSSRDTWVPLILLLLGSVAGFGCLAVLHRGLFEVALLMSKIDLIAFGGGFASVPLMYHEVVEVRSWLDAQTFLNGIILGQFTPGPIVITATFVGYMVHGPVGAIVATAAVFLPSFLVLVGVAPWFSRLRARSWFNGAVSGVLSSFVGLLLATAVRFALNVQWDWSHLALASAALAALLFKVDILWVVLAATAISALAL